MDHIFCKQLTMVFSSHALETLTEYSLFIATNKSGEINVLLVSTENFMAEICINPPESNKVELVILPTNGRTEAQFISSSELIMLLRTSKRKLIHHIEL